MPRVEPDMRVLVNPDRYERRCGSAIDLGIQDICNLRDHAVCVGEIGLRRETINRRQFREIYLCRRFKCKILQTVIFALEIGLPLKTERIETGKVFLPEFPALIP